MKLTQRIGAALVAGVVGISAAGLGTGVAYASTAGAPHVAPAVSQSARGPVEPASAQTVDWHGRGHWHDREPGFWPGWHPWGWGWHPSGWGWGW
jgi:hypothetical protein